ncbi:MAG: hypothetical protein HQM11_04090 [SAR324 cluster bacterium]|nr:hypothetical protein [SAR324 cluster bacterium]
MKLSLLKNFLLIGVALLVSSCSQSVPKPVSDWQITISSGDAFNAIQWNMLENNVGYQLYWSTEPNIDERWANRISMVPSPLIHRYLKNGQTYFYRLVQVDQEGNILSRSSEFQGTPHVKEEQSLRPTETVEISSQPASANAVPEETNKEPALPAIIPFTPTPTTAEMVPSGPLSVQQEQAMIVGMSIAVFEKAGIQCVENKRYPDAMARFKQESSGTAEALEKLKNYETELQAQAEIHYREGIQYFINEHYEQAIKEWTEVLALYPCHARVRDNLSRAHGILKKLQQMEH